MGRWMDGWMGRGFVRVLVWGFPSGLTQEEHTSRVPAEGQRRTEADMHMQLREEARGDGWWVMGGRSSCGQSLPGGYQAAPPPSWRTWGTVSTSLGHSVSVHMTVSVRNASPGFESLK